MRDAGARALPGFRGLRSTRASRVALGALAERSPGRFIGSLALPQLPQNPHFSIKFKDFLEKSCRKTSGRFSVSRRLCKSASICIICHMEAVGGGLPLSRNNSIGSWERGCRSPFSASRRKLIVQWNFTKQFHAPPAAHCPRCCRAAHIASESKQIPADVTKCSQM